MALRRFDSGKILWVALIIVATLLGACSEKSSELEPIYSCEKYTVTADSVVAPGYNFGAGDVAAVQLPESLPRISLTRLLDRLYDAGVEAMLADTTYNSPYALLSEWLALPLIDVDEAQRRLDAVIGPDGLPVAESDGYTWPLTNARALWAVAAWEVYCAGGSRQWLEKSCRITAKMLAADSAVAFRRDFNLICGTILDPDPVRRVIYPRWMDATAQFESMCLSNNAAAVAALNAYANMLGELGGESSEQLQADARRRAKVIGEAVNRRLWIPEKGYYSQYIYGGQFPLQSPATDNFGQALAIMAGIPIAEMTEMALRRSPMVAGGPSASQPSAVGTQPYGLHESWPAVQTMWAIAAASANQAAPFNFAAASLIAHGAGGTTTANRIGVATMLLRALAGITLTADRLEFHPFFTRGFASPMKISNLRYRNATLDITISGTGNRIARFAVDSVETPDYFIDAAIAGHHTLDITLANNTPALNDVEIVAQTWLPPVPEVTWPNHRTAEIADFKPSAKYMVYLNGVPYQTTETQSYRAPNVDAATFISFAEIGRHGSEGYIGKPRLLLPRGALTTLQVEEFAEAGTSLVRERRLSQRFVESARGSSAAKIVVEITEPDDRNCIVDLCYANGNGLPSDGNACAIRSLTVNGTPCGTFLLPARGDGWWLSTAFSNTLRCQLRQGINRLEITVPEGYGQPLTVLIDYLRIIRL